MTPHLPSAQEIDLHTRFTVNRHYLQAVAHFLADRYGQGTALHTGLRDAVRALPAWQRTQRSTTVDLEEVRRNLVLAWTSEIQLTLPQSLALGGQIGFFNAWAPVHAYYAAYGLMQAWFVASSLQGEAGDHTAALKTMSALINQRRSLPEPWSVLAVGCATRGERAYLHEPAGADCAAKMEVLSIPISADGPEAFWARYGTWLHSTRKARLGRREDQWKKDNHRKAISPKARNELAANLAPTSFFDCLWRMRIRSNYGQVDPFVISYIPESEHRMFLRALAVCIDATLGVLEEQVARKIGRDAYGRIAEDFIAGAPPDVLSDTLVRRLDAYNLRPR